MMQGQLAVSTRQRRKPRADVYQFAELSESAKERAREWYREGALQHEWWRFIYEDARAVGEMMGIEICDISFVLHVQGSGAWFDGDYGHAPNSAALVKDHAPSDGELHEIAAILAGLQMVHGQALFAVIERKRDDSVWIEVTEGEDGAPCLDEHADKLLRDTLRRFMRWIHGQLEAEYEYQMSDEVVDEMIEGNEYEFTEDGDRA